MSKLGTLLSDSYKLKAARGESRSAHGGQFLLFGDQKGASKIALGWSDGVLGSPGSNIFDISKPLSSGLWSFRDVYPYLLAPSESPPGTIVAPIGEYDDSGRGDYRPAISIAHDVGNISLAIGDASSEYGWNDDGDLVSTLVTNFYGLLPNPSVFSGSMLRRAESFAAHSFGPFLTHYNPFFSKPPIYLFNGSITYPSISHESMKLFTSHNENSTYGGTYNFLHTTVLAEEAYRSMDFASRSGLYPANIGGGSVQDIYQFTLAQAFTTNFANNNFKRRGLFRDWRRTYLFGNESAANSYWATSAAIYGKVPACGVNGYHFFNATYLPDYTPPDDSLSEVITQNPAIDFAKGMVFTIRNNFFPQRSVNDGYFPVSGEIAHSYFPSYGISHGGVVYYGKNYKNLVIKGSLPYTSFRETIDVVGGLVVNHKTYPA